MTIRRPDLPSTALLSLLLAAPGCGQDPVGASGSGPSGAPDSRASAVAEVEATETTEEGEPDYRHPLGVGFDLPEGWHVEEVPQGLRLFPRDPARGPHGDAEMHLVGMIGADPSVQSLEDRRVPGLVLQLVRSELPFVRATAAPRGVEGRDDLRVFTFAGRSPLGQQVECRVHGLLQGGWFVAFTAVAEPAQLEKRDAELREVVAGLELGAPRADRADLAGTWFSQAMASAGGIRDRLHVATTTRIQVAAGGLLGSGSQSTMVGRDRLGGSVTGLTDETRSAGRWACVGDDLYVVWKDGGSGRFRIHLQGAPGRREMLLTPTSGRGNKLLWTEYRM